MATQIRLQTRCGSDYNPVVHIQSNLGYQHLERWEFPLITTTLESIRTLKSQVEQSVIGQSEVVEKIIIGLLCNGNLLLEGLPGTAKTRSVKSLASILQADLGRIQFTPDLMPSDILGSKKDSAYWTYHGV